MSAREQAALRDHAARQGVGLSGEGAERWIEKRERLLVEAQQELLTFQRAEIARLETAVDELRKSQRLTREQRLPIVRVLREARWSIAEIGQRLRVSTAAIGEDVQILRGDGRRTSPAWSSRRAA